MSDEIRKPTDDGTSDAAKEYEQPTVEDLDTGDGPAMTAGSGPGITTPG